MGSHAGVGVGEGYHLQTSKVLQVSKQGSAQKFENVKPRTPRSNIELI